MVLAPRMLSLVLVATLLAGCETPSGAGGHGANEEAQGAADPVGEEDAQDPTQYSLRGGQLLPMKGGRIYWYRAVLRPEQAPVQVR